MARVASRLVDSCTHSLRIIDLGAACQLGEQDRFSGPCSQLYCPPEMLRGSATEISATSDVFSAAAVWLRFVVPFLPHLDRWGGASLLDDMRHDRQCDLETWLTRAMGQAAAGSAPHQLMQIKCRSAGGQENGWEGAWDLICSMLRWGSPVGQRITAARALSGPYLGAMGV